MRVLAEIERLDLIVFRYIRCIDLSGLKEGLHACRYVLLQLFRCSLHTFLNGRKRACLHERMAGLHL